MICDWQPLLKRKARALAARVLPLFGPASIRSEVIVPHPGGVPPHPGTADVAVAQPFRQWAGLGLKQPRVMAILNVTPDSFSDGGRHGDARAAIVAGLAMAAEGAEIVDVGGESTRPGSSPIDPAEEQLRVVPVIAALAAAGITVSADTRNAGTMQAALNAGASIINDVSGLTHDPLSVSVVRDHDCAVVLMHMRGTPATMATLAVYQNVIAEVRSELLLRIGLAISAGIRPERIAIDPGLGFAKWPPHSLAVLRDLEKLTELGYPVVVGASRKSFIGAVRKNHKPIAD